MIKTLLIGLVAAAWLAVSPAAAESQLFADSTPLHIALTAPFPDLVRSAPEAPKPYPATLTLENAAAPQTFQVGLQARGVSRRRGGICRFPPLWVRFDKSQLHGTLFHGEHKLKLVTYCQPAAGYDQHIVLEYLAYRLYNVITPVSYRVRAAEVTYRTAASDAGLTRFGYLIEDIGGVAARNGLAELNVATHQVTAAQLDPTAAGRAALFEFMISNLDWDFLAATPGTECCHNVRLLAAPGATPASAAAVAPLPYDFDQSGLVDAPYAEAPAGLPVNNVTERLYRGYCVSNSQIASVIDEYRAHRAELMAVISNEPELDPRFRDKADRYLQGFFKLLDDPGRVQREIVRRCR
jgi:hypothetical protein